MEDKCMLKLIFTTFVLVFVAELGDKTQIATMLMAAKNNSVWPVFIGASLALVCSSLVGVFAGSVLSKYIPPNYLQNGAAVAFIIIGILLLFGKV
jgi:putative Ca2+/H+ antiporter (TMEM165/GDT1 family)